MRERLPAFEYHSPDTLEEATSLLISHDSSALLQGGTDLVVAIRQKGLRPAHVVSLRKLKDSLSYVRRDKNYLRIGSMTSISFLNESLSTMPEFEVLLEGTNTIGSYQIRNAATIGGNLCNASPAADSAPPLLVLAASLRARGIDGERSIPIEQFFVGPGKTILKKGEILREVAIPSPPAHSGGAFVKLGRREGEDIAVASAAAYVELAKDGTVRIARIAMGSVAPIPMRAREAEGLLLGEISDSKLENATDSASRECQPITDVRSSAAYRRSAAKFLTKSVIVKALHRATGGIGPP